MPKSRIEKFSETEFKEIVLSSFGWRELYRKLGYTCSCNSHTKDTIQKYLNKYNLNVDHFTSSPIARTKRKTNEEIFKENSEVSSNTVRTRFLKNEYQKYKCSICGLEPFWNGKSLVLTLDHINGIHNDNRLENLRWVCPNCDRQLDTFAGKNKAYKNA